MIPKAVSRYIAPTTAALALVAGGGEAINGVVGHEIAPATEQVSANTADGEVNCPAPTVAGVFPKVIGRAIVRDTLPGYSYSLNNVTLPGTNYPVAWVLKAGPEGATLNGARYQAGETLLYEGQVAKTNAFQSRDPQARGTVSYDFSREIHDIKANDAVLEISDFQTPEERLKFAKKIVDLDCQVKESQNTIDTTTTETPQPEAPSEEKTEVVACPVEKPAIDANINMPRFVRVGGRAVIRWSVENTDIIPLLSPETTVSLPKGSSLVGSAPRGYRLSGGSKLVRNALESDIFESDEEEEAKVTVTFTNTPRRFRTTASVKASAGNPKIGPDGKPCKPAKDTARTQAIILPKETKTPPVAVAGSLEK